MSPFMFHESLLRVKMRALTPIPHHFDSWFLLYF